MSIFNGKYTSIYEIILSAYRDSGMDQQINIADAVEWAGEAIELIGGAYQLEDKIEVLLIDCFKTKLPCELHYINGVKGLIKSDAAEIEECEFSISSFTPMIYSSDIYHRYIIPNNSTNSIVNRNLTYKVNDDYLFTNFEKGFIALSYKAVPVDNDGFPKIPDDIKFKNAVKYHIMWKLALLNLKTNKVSSEYYRIIERDRDWYIGAAQTRSHMPSMDMMESIKNNWIRLIPKINQHRDGFKSANMQEQRILHNAGTYNRNNSNNNTYFYKR